VLRSRLAIGVVSLSLAFAGELAAPAVTGAGVVDCPNVPVVGQACDAGNAVLDNTAGRAANGVEDVVGGAAQAVGGGILDLIAKAVASAAVWFLHEIAGLVGATTQVHLTDITSCGSSHGGAARCYQPVSWFGHRYGAMWGLATLFALGLLFVVVVESVLRGAIGVLVETALLKLPLAFVFTGAAIALTGMLLQLTDRMSTAIAGNVGSDAGDFFSAVGKTLAALGAGTGPGAPVFVVLLAALVIVVGALFVWLELLMRAASIYVVVFFLPFAFAALIWPRSAGVLRRVIELLLVLIFSKFVIVAILSLASGALGNAPASAAGVSQVFGGGAILLLAAFSPFALFKLVPFLEGTAVGGIAGRGAATVGAAAAPAGPARVMRTTLASNWARRSASDGAGADPSAGARSAGAPSARPGAISPRAGSAGGSGPPAGGAGAAAAGASAAAAAAGTAAAAGPVAARRLERTAPGRRGAQGGDPPIARAPDERKGRDAPAPEEPTARPPRNRLDQDPPERT
jgi:hypothetical protein